MSESQLTISTISEVTGIEPGELEHLSVYAILPVYNPTIERIFWEEFAEMTGREPLDIMQRLEDAGMAMSAYYPAHIEEDPTGEHTIYGMEVNTAHLLVDLLVPEEFEKRLGEMISYLEQYFDDHMIQDSPATVRLNLSIMTYAKLLNMLVMDRGNRSNSQLLYMAEEKFASLIHRNDHDKTLMAAESTEPLNNAVSLMLRRSNNIQ